MASTFGGSVHNLQVALKDSQAQVGRAEMVNKQLQQVAVGAQVKQAAEEARATALAASQEESTDLLAKLREELAQQREENAADEGRAEVVTRLLEEAVEKQTADARLIGELEQKLAGAEAQSRHWEDVAAAKSEMMAQSIKGAAHPYSLNAPLLVST